MNPPDFRDLRAGRPDCPSDFTLDRLHSGELPQEKAQETERHVAGCADCGARMAERRAGFGAIEGVDPRAMLARIRTGLDSPARRPLSARILDQARRLLAPMAVVATAAVALVMVNRQDVESPTTRMKGSPALHVFRLEGDHAVEAISGDKFAPGDRLRFIVDLPTEGHVAVVGIEPSGKLYTAWPLDSEVQTRFAAGSRIMLPGAVALDNQPGRETLHLVHCPVAVGPPECTSGGVGAKPVCPAGCVTTPFILDKTP